MRGVAVIVALALLLCGRVAAQPVKVLHLKVSGPIDCAAMADEFGAELERARAAGVGYFILELDGPAARLDLVHAMGERLRSCGIPSAALLRGRAGLGQAVLALHAGACYMEPRGAVVASAEDGRAELARLAPADADWERIHRELAGLLWTALRERSADPELASMLVHARESGWVVEADGVCAIATKEPEVGGVRIAWAAGAQPARLEIDAAMAVKLRLAAGTAEGVGQVLAAAEIDVGPREARTIRSGLAPARARVEKSLADAEVALQRVRTALNFRSRLDRTVTDSDYRRAGEEALRLIADIDAGLAAIERAGAEYPELLVFARPSPRSTRPPADSVFGRLERLRKDLEKPRVTAREYATRR